MVNLFNKLVFLEALLIAILLLGIGLAFGVYFENNRSNVISDLYYDYEISVSDIAYSLDILNNHNLSCKDQAAILYDLNEKVYNIAVRLEKYDNSNKITPDLIVLHKRYDLLRTLLWENYIYQKDICDLKINTVVYLYKYKNPSSITKGIQGGISNYLVDLDKQYPNDVVLIPIAADLDIISLNILMNLYNVSDYPSVVINEKNVLNNINEIKNSEQYLILNK
jgi:hypothetical protein